MTLPEIHQQFTEGLKNTRWQEYLAVFFGIASVLFSRKENIWVYPTGLINTILYTYFCFAWWQLYAEASLNFYYTVMSIYGWILWAKRKNHTQERKLHITASTKKEWLIALLFFLVCWIGLYLFLRHFTKSNVPVADSFASASAYTGMWLMAKKKLENWIWWIVTNMASIPLYFYKHAVFTSFQYIVFLILAVMGYITWKKRFNMKQLKKIVIIGPESTGKSTLCEMLAGHYHTDWVKEYAREYLLKNGTDYTFENLLEIAKGQIDLEKTLSTNVRREVTEENKNVSLLTSNISPIFIDTDMYVLKVWCEFVFNKCHTWILDQIVERKYDLYLLCNVDLPWVKDELREYPDLVSREKLYHIYKDAMVNQNVPWIEINGNYEERLQKAINAVDILLGLKPPSSSERN